MLSNGQSKLLIFLWIASAMVVACSTEGKDESPPQEKVVATPQELSNRGDANRSSIRSVDFANFTYPWVPDLGDPKKSFTLQRGEYAASDNEVPMHLFSVVYGDVTGDEAEEAMVAFSVGVKGGSARPHVVYIYALIGKHPKLLWAFLTGHRADGGLRQVHSKNGELVIELYGKGKILGTDLGADDGSRAELPYTYYFTRTNYRWNGAKFQQKGTAETLSAAQKHHSPIMPIYSQ